MDTHRASNCSPKPLYSGMGAASTATGQGTPHERTGPCPSVVARSRALPGASAAAWRRRPLHSPQHLLESMVADHKGGNPGATRTHKGPVPDARARGAPQDGRHDPRPPPSPAARGGGWGGGGAGTPLGVVPQRTRRAGAAQWGECGVGRAPLRWGIPFGESHDVSSSCSFTRRYSSNRGCLHFLHRVICLSSVGHSVCIRSRLTLGDDSVPLPFAGVPQHGPQRGAGAPAGLPQGPRRRSTGTQSLASSLNPPEQRSGL